jgi:hypothetical protein
VNTDTPAPPTAALPRRLGVVEINACAPRPFVFSELARCLCDGLHSVPHSLRFAQQIAPAGPPSALWADLQAT